MYKAEFEKLLANGIKKKNFILFGESSFFIDYYTKMLSHIEDANELIFYYDEYDFSAAKAHLSQASLFGGINLLVIKSDKKIPKKELEALFEATNKGENRFIYAYYGSDHKSYNNAFKKLDVVTVRFFHPKQNEAIAILTHEAKKLQLQISPHTLHHLLSLQNGEIELALAELQKLSIHQDSEITTKEIDQLVFGMGEVKLSDFFDNFLAKKPYEQNLAKLLESGEDPIRIITSLTNLIQELFMFNTSIRISGHADVKTILGYTPPQFVINQKAQKSMQIKPKIYYKILEILLQTELVMKSGKADNEALLQSALIQITKLL